MKTKSIIVIALAAILAACQPKDTWTLSGLDQTNFISEEIGRAHV